MSADAAAGTASALRCDGLRVSFSVYSQGRAHHIDALDGVDICVERGRVLGLVGESGSGKSTLARALVGMQRPTSGTVRCGDMLIDARRRSQRRDVGRRISMIFQDPRSSLNPRISVASAIADPLVVHRIGDRDERAVRVTKLLADVGLPPSTAQRRVRALSGGQLQRVAIARALALEPDFVVADEPTSALDVSVQSQILNLLKDLRARHGFGMLLISHDMRLMRAMADDLVVMLNGSIVEQGPTADVFAAPTSDYTRQLIEATPLLPQPFRPID